MSLYTENLLSVLEPFGNIRIWKGKGATEFIVSLEVKWENQDKATFDKIYEERHESLCVAIDKIIVQVVNEVRYKFVLTNSFAEKYRHMADTIKDQLKDIGEWDRLMHPDYYRSQQLSKLSMDGFGNGEEDEEDSD